MKKRFVLPNCPVCDHDLIVKKLECENCKTSIEGEFTLSKFNYLEQEKLFFIEVFVKNRGNIKAIEKELNLSYPTVKKMLDDVIVALGYKLDYVDEFDVVENKMDILDQVKVGKLKVDEALEILKKRG